LSILFEQKIFTIHFILFLKKTNKKKII